MQVAREREINSISGLPLVTCMTVLIQSIFNKLEANQLLESREQATNSSNRRQREQQTPHAMDSASATSDVPSAFVDLTDHNISPAVDKQLVLELERRMRFTEGRQWLPRSLSRRQTCPLNEDVQDESSPCQRTRRPRRQNAKHMSSKSQRMGPRVRSQRTPRTMS